MKNIAYTYPLGEEIHSVSRDPEMEAQTCPRWAFMLSTETPKWKHILEHHPTTATDEGESANLYVLALLGAVSAAF